MASAIEIASAFIEDAPPGELADVVNDVKVLTSDPSFISKLKPAFQKYNEEQLTSSKLPGASQPVLISKYNKLGDDRYFDTESSSSWAFDHVTQVGFHDDLRLSQDLTDALQQASSVQSHALEPPQSELIKSLLKALATYASEHYPSSAHGVYSVENQTVILLSASRYSPANFWNGRWRSTYVYNNQSSSMTGTINVDVHYYEDGNVALTATKQVSITAVGSSASEIIRKIAAAEKAYQEELNRAFVAMNEQSFKGLRRQLPITRQKVEWEKVGGYKLGSDLRGGGPK